MGILLHRSEDVVVSLPEVFLIGAESGHLDYLVVEEDVHDAEAAPDDAGIPEEALDLSG